jgi:hypothetical protein
VYICSNDEKKTTRKAGPNEPRICADCCCAARPPGAGFVVCYVSNRCYAMYHGHGHTAFAQHPPWDTTIRTRGHIPAPSHVEEHCMQASIQYACDGVALTTTRLPPCYAASHAPLASPLHIECTCDMPEDSPQHTCWILFHGVCRTEARRTLNAHKPPPPFEYAPQVPPDDCIPKCLRLFLNVMFAPMYVWSTSFAAP